VISPEDLRAYRRGVEEEIAVGLGPNVPASWADVEAMGAMAAGLDLPQYRAMTVAVERFLKERMSALGDNPARVTSDPVLAMLDSLRAERLVLQVRLRQTASDPAAMKTRQ
jgi:hypothetical protein